MTINESAITILAVIALTKSNQPSGGRGLSHKVLGLV